MITIYGAEWCGPCHTAKGYLKQLGISYDYKNIDEDPAAGLESYNKSGERAIPVLDIDGEIIVGFDRQRIDEALKKHPQT